MPRNASGAASARHPLTLSLPMPGSTSTGTARSAQQREGQREEVGRRRDEQRRAHAGAQPGVQQPGGDPVDAGVERGVRRSCGSRRSRRQREGGAVGVRAGALGEQPVERGRRSRRGEQPRRDRDDAVGGVLEHVVAGVGVAVHLGLRQAASAGGRGPCSSKTGSCRPQQTAVGLSASRCRRDSVRARTPYAGSRGDIGMSATNSCDRDPVRRAVVRREQPGAGLAAEHAAAPVPMTSAPRLKALRPRTATPPSDRHARGRERPRQRLAGRDRERAGVEDEQLVDALDVVDGPGQRDGAAPVVHDERHRLVEAETVDELAEVGDPARERVRVLRRRRLLRPAHADVVGRDRAQAERRQGARAASGSRSTRSGCRARAARAGRSPRRRRPCGGRRRGCCAWRRASRRGRVSAAVTRRSRRPRC